MFNDLLAVASGGALGAVSRYYLAGWMQSRFPQFEPAGTLLVNVLGCFLIGLLVMLELQGQYSNRFVRAFAITGVLGSLTTFSTFGYQTVELARQQQIQVAILNVTANLLLGCVAVLAGLAAGRWLWE